MRTKKQNNRLNPVPYFIVCLSVTVLFDFYVTNLILHNMYIHTNELNFIDIVYVPNTGAAFSYFQNSTLMLILFSIAAFIFILYELFRKMHKYSLAMYFASAILSAGIICNTYERITLGYVRDFISFKFFEFPVFNISDVLINLGVLAIILLVITKKYKYDEK